MLKNPWIGCFKSQKITKLHLLICNLENGLRNTLLPLELGLLHKYVVANTNGETISQYKISN